MMFLPSPTHNHSYDDEQTEWIEAQYFQYDSMIWSLSVVEFLGMGLGFVFPTLLDPPSFFFEFPLRNYLILFKEPHCLQVLGEEGHAQPSSCHAAPPYPLQPPLSAEPRGAAASPRARARGTPRTPRTATATC